MMVLAAGPAGAWLNEQVGVPIVFFEFPVGQLSADHVHEETGNQKDHPGKQQGAEHHAVPRSLFSAEHAATAPDRAMIFDSHPAAKAPVRIRSSEIKIYFS
jgi:hypothetical protein